MFVYVRHLSRFRVWDTAGLSRGLSAFVKPVKILMHKYFGFCRLDSDGCHFKDIQLQAKRDAIILCVCLCVCVCLRERERERERECVCVVVMINNIVYQHLLLTDGGVSDM